MATGSSFITYDKMDRIAAIQNAAEDDTFALSGFAPIAMGEEGVAESKVGGPTNYSWLLAANISEEEKANTIKYVDWLYSQDGILVTNWGIEGESYEVAEDGTWKFKEDFVYEGSGLGVPSICAYRDIDVFKLAQEENVLEALEICLPYAKSPNDPMLHYTEDQQIEMDTYYQTVYDSSLANIQKFILGQRDIDTEWDAYVAEMEGMHLQELIDIHQAAYDRIYGGK
jgi:putative aldouronate transport system substrate-binding protein